MLTTFVMKIHESSPPNGKDGNLLNDGNIMVVSNKQKSHGHV